jgi:stage V sporulation protein S
MAENAQSKVMVLKVAATSNPASVAGAIAKNKQEGKEIHLSAVGAGAINQMNKAVAIASGYLAPSGVTIAVKIGFIDIQIADEEGVMQDKTAIIHKVIEV